MDEELHTIYISGYNWHEYSTCYIYENLKLINAYFSRFLIII